MKTHQDQTTSYFYQDDPLWQALESRWMGLEFTGRTPEQLAERVADALQNERHEVERLVAAVEFVLACWNEDTKHIEEGDHSELATVGEGRLAHLHELLEDVKHHMIRRRLEPV